jgi:hypothetical protein
MSTTPEGRVKAAVKRLLKARGVWFYCPMQNGMGVSGIPDFICCWEGRFLAIETKAPGRRNSTTANQKERIREIIDSRGIAIVIDDVAQLQEVLGASPQES